MRTKLAVLAVCVMALVPPAAAVAQEAEGFTVTGVGEIARAPDVAIVRLGVERRGASSERAVEELSVGANAVFDALRAAGVAEADIQTSALRLAPLRDGIERVPGAPRPMSARTTFRIEVRDLDTLGRILDAGIGAGANRVDGVAFTLADPEDAVRAAQRAAVADARASAETYADAAGVTLGRVRALTDHGGGPRPSAMAMEAAPAADDLLPVAPGQITVSARVTVTFDLRRRR